MIRNNHFTSQQTRFKAHSENICGLIEDAGILFRPYSQPSLSFFSQLSASEQSDVLRNMMVFYQICLDSFVQGSRLTDSKALTRQALLRLGFDEDPDLIARIDENQLVEIYNLEHTQIFRSLRFFEITSYTLEDLYCRKWYHLWDRNENDLLEMNKIVTQLFTSAPEQKIFTFEGGVHLLKEKDSLERLTIKSQTKWLARLYRGNVFEGILAVHDSEIA